jgi:hypothetical protein
MTIPYVPLPGTPVAGFTGPLAYAESRHPT